MSKTPDRRFTVSVDAQLADKVDDFVNNSEGANRSGVVEEALRLWESLASYPDKDHVLQEAMKLYEQQQEQELYRSYYAELSDEARREDAGWRELAADTAAKHWPVADENKIHR